MSFVNVHGTVERDMDSMKVHETEDCQNAVVVMC